MSSRSGRRRPNSCASVGRWPPPDRGRRTGGLARALASHLSLKVAPQHADTGVRQGVRSFPGGEWEHVAVEGATLRRLKRSWVSVVTSVCALAIASSMMALSDG